jgi:hypothetical protein
MWRKGVGVVVGVEEGKRVWEVGSVGELLCRGVAVGVETLCQGVCTYGVKCPRSVGVVEAFSGAQAKRTQARIRIHTR